MGQNVLDDERKWIDDRDAQNYLGQKCLEIQQQPYQQDGGRDRELKLAND